MGEGRVLLIMGGMKGVGVGVGYKFIQPAFGFSLETGCWYSTESSKIILLHNLLVSQLRNI